ncbi:MAG: ABC transporter ATP-binding protein [Myxococcota bacterium]|nr:ABC transporter ATP-binding protein [Myxococcota bacterium]
MQPIVNIKKVTKDYPLGKTVVHALRGIDLQIGRGEFTAIAGPSGSGKTTLLNLVGCVDVPTSGSVLIADNNIEALSDTERTKLRLSHLGFIFQSFNLVQVLNLFQNVEFPLLLQGSMTAGERRKRVEEIVEHVGLTDQLKQRPNELSGGQRQRVAIARALVTRPQIVLADEPTANLDSGTGQNIIDLMKHMNEQESTTFIFSTHDHRVMHHAQRIVTLEDGLITNAHAPAVAMGA